MDNMFTREEVKAGLQYLEKEQLVEIIASFMMLDLRTHNTMLESYIRAVMEVQKAVKNFIALLHVKTGK